MIDHFQLGANILLLDVQPESCSGCFGIFSDIGTEFVTIETTRRGGSSGYRHCRCRTLLYLPCIFRLRTETIWVSANPSYIDIHRICSYIFICDIYKGVGGGHRGSFYPLYVTTTDLLSVWGFTALSAIHKELLCHIVIRTEKWLIRYRY